MTTEFDRLFEEFTVSLTLPKRDAVVDHVRQLEADARQWRLLQEMQQIGEVDNLIADAAKYHELKAACEREDAAGPTMRTKAGFAAREARKAAMK